ncbi:MAG TPA: TonB-dependent receptor, partial [Bacteroidia bacterium]|nr:TonB-dependent receptor [Bacteroidia bacterium]
LTDLSIIPSYITDNISLIQGGSSPVNGNSSLGSTLILEDHDPEFIHKSKLKANFEGGSFGNIHATGSYQFANTFFESRTILFYDEAENNFEFVNYTHRNKPVVEQKNAALTNYGLLQNFEFKINSNQNLSAGIWYQYTNREIPPLMTSSESEAVQRDSNFRAFAAYKIVLKKSVLKIKGAVFQEFQFYDDPKHQLSQKYNINSYLSDVEWRVNIHEKIIWTVGSSYSINEAVIEEYHENQNRTVFSLYSGLLFRPTVQWTINLNLRKDFTNVENPPFAPSLGFEGMVLKNYIRTFGNIGRHYNLPSMNDLYWIPGGNKDLLPEDAWSEELGFIFFKNHFKIPEFTVTGFNSVVDNWIKWLPANAGVYSPDNLRQVHSYGIETSMKYQRKFRQLNFNFRLNYTWCRSTISKTFSELENATLDKQLIYVPENIVNINLSFSFHQLAFYYNHTFTGSRYTTSDNSSSLDGFHVANITLEQKITSGKLSWCVYGKVMNLFDSEYQVLAYHPMPGRWYSAGVKFDLSLISNNSNKINLSK